VCPQDCARPCPLNKKIVRSTMTRRPLMAWLKTIPRQFLPASIQSDAPYGLSGAVPFKNRTIAGSPVREDRPRNSIFLIALALLFRIQHAFERGIEHLE